LAVTLLSGSFVSVAEAQSFTNLYYFTNGTDGAYPVAGLTLSGTTLYGTTQEGGSSGNGTVFAVNTDSAGFRSVYTFTNGTDGASPYAGLTLSGTTLYGTAANGGTAGSGTVFAVNTNGTDFTTICSFTTTSDPGNSDGTNSDGTTPLAGLLLFGNTVYGTAQYGGGMAYGTVFKVNTDRLNFTNLHSFTNGSDGAFPQAGLILSGDTLYGTANGGGSGRLGTVFAVSTNGTGFTNLHSFTGGSDGGAPDAGLILSGNTLYGTAYGGGSASNGTVFKVNTDGSGFTNLHSFTNGSDGANPLGGLILSGNTLFGTASGGGTAGNGTVFAVKTNGTGFTILYAFTETSGSFPGPAFNIDGANPKAGLILSSNILYGTAANGGTGGYGTVFALSALFVQVMANPTTGVAPLTVNFSSSAVDSFGSPITSWNWTFGDGSTSTAQNPSHTYTILGNFYPSLLVTNSNGLQVPGLVPSITVSPLTVAFTANPTTGVVPLTVSFTSEGVDSGGNTITNWNWSFGDGLTSTAQNPTYTYANTGTFFPALIATNSLGVAVSGSGPSITVSPPYEITTNADNTVTITGYTGPGGDVTIPTNINGLTVTSIRQGAFENVISLTSVTIPGSVTNIGVYAFASCTNLTAITVDTNNPAYSSVSGVLFDYSKTTLVEFPDGVGGSYTIPGSVTSIGSYAFWNCASLTSVTIPGSVTNIGDAAFGFCTSLPSITIPGSVTSIGSNAFYFCTRLTNVTIPTSVTNIGQDPFGGCSSLTAITVGTNNPAYSSLAGVLFNKSQTTLIQYPSGNGATSYTIANSVTSIGDYAFWNCASLTSVTIPGNVTSIGADAFSGCSSLISVTIPGSVTSIGADAFYGCSSLTSVTIPASVTSIGDYAFARCFSLTSVTIPRSVTSIAQYAFWGCTSLISVTIPGSVTSIGDDAFASCYSLTSVYFQGNAPTSDWTVFYYSPTTVYYLPGTSGWSSPFGGVPAVMLNPPNPAGSLQATITPAAAITAGAQWQVDGGIPQASGAIVVGLSVGSHTVSFTNISGWVTPSNQTVVVGDNSTATAIGTYVQGQYYSAPYAYSINADNTVTITGYTGPGGAVAIPSEINNLSVTSIGTNAFEGSTNLTSVIIPDGVTNIGDSAFADCTNLTSVTIGNSVTNIGDYAFEYCSALTNVTINYGVTSIGEGAFLGCSGLTNLTIPGSVISIGTNAFSATGLTSVTIPGSVTNIGEGPFDDCTNLIAIAVDATNLFYSSANGVLFDKSKTTLVQYPGGVVGSYTIPSSVASIGDDAFQYCIVTGVTIPGSVTSIGVRAFEFCGMLTGVTIPASVTNIGRDAFYDCTNLTNVTIPGSVTDIGYFTFACCESLTNATIANGVTSIGEGAFYYCTNLTSITIPDSVTNIGAATFNTCTSLTNAAIGNGVASIGEQAFYYCTKLTSVTIPGSVTSIGDGAFESCTGLTNAAIGNGVASIGEQAFYYCTKLTSVTIPGSVTSIGDYAFANCTNLTSVYFQGSAPIAHTTVFYDDPTTVYYLPGTTGWGATFGGAPTALWLLPIPMILNSGPSFGVQSSAFGFVISWATNTSVVVEASSDLANPVWVPFQTNALSNGSFYFSEPLQTNSSGRYYRISAP
jgi:uncharacterized repeat protein (TIGR03803 family)